LGLPPCEHSSQRASQGSITKTGNAHARRLHYRFKARTGKQAQIRQQDLSVAIWRIPCTAHARLTDCFAALNGCPLTRQICGSVRPTDSTRTTILFVGACHPNAAALRGSHRHIAPQYPAPPSESYSPEWYETSPAFHWLILLQREWSVPRCWVHPPWPRKT